MMTPVDVLRTPRRREGITPLIFNLGHWMDVNNELEAQKRFESPTIPL
jgi:hypothetical protein